MPSGRRPAPCGRGRSPTSTRPARTATRWIASTSWTHRTRPARRRHRAKVVHGGDPTLFWSLSYAVSATAWRRTGGFDEAYVGYGAEDTDFGRRADAAGLEMAWVGGARAYHQHHPVSRPPVEHLDDILRNGRTYRERWGHWPMRGWLDEFERQGLVTRVDGDYVPVTGP